MKKIIFFVLETHFTIRFYNDLYVKQLSQYFETEMWDGLNLNQNEETKLLSANIEVQHRISEAVIIKDLDELERRLKSLTSPPVIITQYFSNIDAFNLIKQYQGIIIDINKVSFHLFLRSKAYKYSLKFQVKRLIRFIRKFKNKSNIPLIDYSFNPLNISEVKVKEYIRMHHIKYDDFLIASAQEPIIEQRYIVFLDSNIPFIEDYVLKGESINPDKYYKQLNELFEHLEEKYNCNVVIAPHPSANYSKELFKNREVIVNKTSNLIINSIGCIAHDSTSNITAILAKKPIIFIVTDDMRRRPAVRRAFYVTKEFAKILGHNTINLDNYKYIPDFKFNYQKYSEFERKFLIVENRKNQTNTDIIRLFINAI